MDFVFKTSDEDIIADFNARLIERERELRNLMALRETNPDIAKRVPDEKIEELQGAIIEMRAERDAVTAQHDPVAAAKAQIVERLEVAAATSQAIAEMVAEGVPPENIATALGVSADAVEAAVENASPAGKNKANEHKPK